MESKLAAAVRPPKDTKEKERLRRARLDLEAFIKDKIIAGLVDKAHCYGESLQVCKDI